MQKPKFPATCDDGDKCTKSDTCNINGTCAGSKISCNDKQVCTVDSCDAATGACKFVGLNKGSCSDGDSCTVSDACSSGVCKGKAKDCDDKNACTADACDKSKGCQYSPTNEGQFCANTRICADSKCACKYLSVTEGIAPAVTEELRAIVPTPSGGIIAFGRRYKTGAGYEGLCQAVNLGNQISVSATIAGSAKNETLRGAIAFGSDQYLAVGEYYDLNKSKTYGWLLTVDGACKQKKSTTLHDSGSYKNILRAAVSDGGTGAWAVGQRGDGLPDTQYGWLLHVNSGLSKLKSVKVGDPFSKTLFDAVVRDKMGNYLAAGYTNSKSAGGKDGTLVMFNASGSTMWQQRYGTSAEDKFHGMALDGNFVWMVGETGGNGVDQWVVKADLMGGKSLYSKTFGGSNSEVLHSIAVSGSTRVAVGYTKSVVDTDGAGHIMLLSSTGNADKNVYGGNSAGYDAWQAVTFVSDGRIFAAGQYYDSVAKSLNPWVRSFGASLDFSCN